MAAAVDGTTISNSGTVGVHIGAASGNPVLVTSTGTIVTTGVYAIGDTVLAADAITNYGKLEGEFGIDVYGADSPIVNFGNIAGSGTGVFFLSSGTVTNGSPTDKTASISGSSAIAIGGSAGPSTVTNYGSVTASNEAVSDNGTAPLTVSNFGKISGGILSEGALALSNSGSITTGSDANGVEFEGGTLVNGSATDTTASITAGDDALLIGGANAATVTNFGKIAGTSTTVGEGIASSGSGPITIVNGTATDRGATISGGFEGISVAGLSDVTNFGSIKGSNAGVTLGGGGTVTNGSNADTSASIIGGVRIDGGPHNSLTNFGTITDGAFVNGGGGTVTNGSATDRTALISGPDGIGGVTVAGSGGEVINYGTIAAPSAVSISGTVVNYGLITSLGTPYAAINFDDQPGELIEEPGSAIDGPILGADDITVVIADDGSAAVTGASVSADNFGAVAVDAGVTWTVSSVGTVPTITNDGTISISSGDSLDVLTDVNPSSSGIFELTGTSSLEIATILGAGTKIEFLGSTPSNKLIIDKAASFGTHVGTTSYAGPLLEDFKAGDVIDLKGIAPTGLTLHYAATSGDLQITGSGGHAVATLAFQNTTLGAGSFHVASDGSTGTLLTHS